MGGVFLYDGGSRLFARSARWLARHAGSTARVEAWQEADLAPLGLSATDCVEGLQWVDSGRREVGPDAVAAYLQTSTDRWRTAGRVLTAPVSKRVAWPVYRWASHHRDDSSDSVGDGAATREETPRSGRLRGIRRRRPRDIPACASLLGVVFTEGQYPVRWPDAPRAWLNDEEVVDAWVFERGGEVHGHIAVTKVGLDTRSALRWRELTGREPSELAGITRFFVRPRLRGQGIGRALLDEAVADIRVRGLTPVADVVSRSADAIRLYEDLGWRRRAGYPWGEQDEHLEVYFYEAPAETADLGRR
jgi:GNAT superfamily N-acetyltransferase